MKHEVGNIIEVIVSGIEKYGIFVSIDNNYTGLIHISEISSKFIKNIENYAKVGDKLNAKIIGINEESNQIKLSMKESNSLSNKHKRVKLESSEEDFLELKRMLDIWIDVKIKELTEKSTNKT